MPKRLSKRKISRDMNVLAARIVAESTGEPIPKNLAEESTKNPAAVSLGRLGGLASAKVRMQKISPEKRKEIAKRAANKRWKRG